MGATRFGVLSAGAYLALLIAGCNARSPLGPAVDRPIPTTGGADASSAGVAGAGGSAAGSPFEEDAATTGSGGQLGTAGSDAGRNDGGSDVAEVPTDALTTGPDAFAPASSTGSSVAYQVDIAHTGNQPTSKLSVPLTRAWTVDLGGAVSYPLVVGGRVFVTVSSSGIGGSQVEALDLQSGKTVWGPVDVGGSFHWSNAAYDQGRVYVVNFDGLMTALDAGTGATDWVEQMPGQYAFTSPPTAAGGLVFVGGAGSGGTVYGVNGSTGQVLWTAEVENGDSSSPTLSADAVYVSYACVQAYAFAPLDGRQLWHHSGTCEGGGGNTAVLSQGRLWARDLATGNLVLDATTGDTVGAFSADAIPAFQGSLGFFLVGQKLQALDAGTRAVQWTFAGDGMLATPALVVNGTVYVGSSSGMIYAVDPSTGMSVWSDLAPEGISPADEFGAASQPIGGMGAGDDSLVVPAGTHLLCYR